MMCRKEQTLCYLSVSIKNLTKYKTPNTVRPAQEFESNMQEESDGASLNCTEGNYVLCKHQAMKHRNNYVGNICICAKKKRNPRQVDTHVVV